MDKKLKLNEDGNENEMVCMGTGLATSLSRGKSGRRNESERDL